MTTRLDRELIASAAARRARSTADLEPAPYRVAIAMQRALAAMRTAPDDSTADHLREVAAEAAESALREQA